MTDQPDRPDGDGLLPLLDLPMYWQGRATALGLLNDRRVVPDERTKQEIETYEECAKELRTALTAVPPKPAPDAMRAEIQKWRDDAFHKAACIVERHLSEAESQHIVSDILALSSAPMPPADGLTP